MKRFFTFIIFFFVFMAFSGCASKFWYGLFQEIERIRCSNLEDPQQRQDCLDGWGGMSYDQYQKEREQYQKEQYEQYQKEREQNQKEQYKQYQKEREDTQNNI